jgi:hypothetical protein
MIADFLEFAPTSPPKTVTTVAARSGKFIRNWNTHMNLPFPSVMTVLRAALLVLLALPLAAQSADHLAGKNVSIAQTNYKGRSAIQVMATPGAAIATSYAVIKDVLFRDGTIEVDLAGQPAAGADLKLDPREGRVALWIEPGTESYFSNLKITAK